MKKIVIALIVIITLLTLLGCSSEYKIIEGDTNFIYSAHWQGQLIKYDLANKKATIACPDPMCEHGEDCLVSNVSDDICVSEDYIMFKSGAWAQALYCYDLKKGVIEKVMDYTSCQSVGIYDNFAFFSAAHMIYDDEGKPIRKEWYPYKYDMAKKKLTKLSDKPLNTEKGILPFGIDDNKILWRDGNGETFATDFNFNEKSWEYTPMLIGDYIYSNNAEYQEDGSFYWNFSRTHISDGTVEEVIHAAFSYRLDNDDNPTGILFNTFHNGSDGNTLYRVKFDDLSVEELCDIPDGYLLSELYTAFGSRLYSGDYVGVYVHPENAEESNFENLGDTMLFVNVKTKEYFILAP